MWSMLKLSLSAVFFLNDTATTEIYTLSLHDALPIFFESRAMRTLRLDDRTHRHLLLLRSEEHTSELQSLAYLVCRLLLAKKIKGADNTVALHRALGVDRALGLVGHG